MDDGTWRSFDEGATDFARQEVEAEIGSAAIARLVEEVRFEETGVPRSYNRTFNRHNR